MTFQHPVNGYQRTTRRPGLMCLLAGPFYFGSHGIWWHAILSAVLAVLSFGFTWVVYPIFAEGIVRNAYLTRGWIEVPEPGATPPAPPTTP